MTSRVENSFDYWSRACLADAISFRINSITDREMARWISKAPGLSLIPDDFLISVARTAAREGVPLAVAVREVKHVVRLISDKLVESLELRTPSTIEVVEGLGFELFSLDSQPKLGLRIGRQTLQDAYRTAVQKAGSYQDRYVVWDTRVHWWWADEEKGGQRLIITETDLDLIMIRFVSDRGVLFSIPASVEATVFALRGGFSPFCYLYGHLVRLGKVPPEAFDYFTSSSVRDRINLELVDGLVILDDAVQEIVSEYHMALVGGMINLNKS